MLCDSEQRFTVAGVEEHLWQAAAETWRSGPVIIPVQMSPFCLLHSTKNHRQQISPSKPLCERQDWKDMKALACLLARLLARLTPSFLPAPTSPSPFSFRSSVSPTSFNLRYSVTVCCGVVQLQAASESSPQSHEYPCLCSLKGSTSCSTYSTRSAERAALPSAARVSRSTNIANRTSECAD